MKHADIDYGVYPRKAINYPDLCSQLILENERLKAELAELKGERKCLV